MMHQNCCDMHMVQSIAEDHMSVRTAALRFFNYFFLSLHFNITLPGSVARSQWIIIGFRTSMTWRRPVASSSSRPTRVKIWSLTAGTEFRVYFSFLGELWCSCLRSRPVSTPAYTGHCVVTWNLYSIFIRAADKALYSALINFQSKMGCSRVSIASESTFSNK